MAAKSFYWSVAGLLLFSCTKERAREFERVPPEQLTPIVLEDAHGISTLSKVFDFESYVLPDTAVVIGTIGKILQAGDYLFIGDFKNTKEVYCYHRQGQLRWKCGLNTPTFKERLLDFSVNFASKTLHVLLERSVCSFDSTGRLLNRLALDAPAGKLVTWQDGGYLLYHYDVAGCQYKAWTADGKLQSEGGDALPFCAHAVAGISDLNYAAFMKKAIHSEFLNDTLFHVESDKVVPRYLVDFGKLRLAADQKAAFKTMNYPEVMQVISRTGKAAGPDIAYETENVVHFSFLHEGRYQSLYYDKRSRRVIRIGKQSDDLFEGAFGFIPFGVLPDDRFVFVLEPQLLHHASQSGKKHPDKIPSLVKELLAKTNDLSNPVLVIGKFKPQNHE